MYQQYYALTEMPFNLTPDLDFFCSLKGHKEALQTLLFCIQQGEGFIKVIGEVGSGKTIVCRKLLALLPEETFYTVYIPNPDLSPDELRKAIANELGVDHKDQFAQHELMKHIFDRLVFLHQSQKKVVLLIDEAQALSNESLETVRLLTNFETGKNKLIQIVLFGQPELDYRLNQNHLRQLKQRIVFSYYLPVLNREEFETYLRHRLMIAGYADGELFAASARKLLYKYSQGIPRLINVIAHKALLVAYGKGEQQVSKKSVQAAVQDTLKRFKNHVRARKLLMYVSIGAVLLFLFMMVMV